MTPANPGRTNVAVMSGLTAWALHRLPEQVDDQVVQTAPILVGAALQDPVKLFGQADVDVRSVRHNPSIPQLWMVPHMDYNGTILDGARVMLAVCEHCSETFDQQRGRRKRRYCAAKCRRAHNRKPSLPPTPEQRERDRVRHKVYYDAHREQSKAYQAVYAATHHAQIKAYRDATVEQTRIYDLERRANNVDAIKAQRAAYYAANREARKAHSAAWIAAHPVEIKRRDAAYYIRNTARILAASQAYSRAHPEMALAKNRVRRARKLNAPIVDLTASQWRGIKALYGHCCVYCGVAGKRLTQDHIVPLSRGGSHTLANVVPACRSCNSRKSANPPSKPVQPALLV